MSELTPYARVFEEARAFEDERWATASGFAWDQLEQIACEHQRGEYGWEQARDAVHAMLVDIGIT